MTFRGRPRSRLYELYVANFAQGLTNRTRVTRNGFQDGHPRFSPDGASLVFTSETGGINDEEPLVRSLVFGAQSSARSMPITSPNAAISRSLSR